MAEVLHEEVQNTIKQGDEETHLTPKVDDPLPESTPSSLPNYEAIEGDIRRNALLLSQINEEAYVRLIADLANGAGILRQRTKDPERSFGVLTGVLADLNREITEKARSAEPSGVDAKR